MAVPWGQHSTIKIAFAGVLYALFPAVLLVLQRLSRSQLALLVPTQTRGNEALGDKRPEVKGLMLPLSLGFGVLSLIVIAVYIWQPHPRPAEELVLRASQPGHNWLLLQPTLAIHFTYGGATFLWSLALGMTFALFAFPIARSFVNATQHPKVFKLGSSLIAVAGLLLAFLA